MSLEQLNNGKWVIVRRVSDTDKDEILTGFKALSEMSRYRRFLYNKSKLDEQELECLLRVSDDQGVSLIALEVNPSHSGAEGRCIGLIQLIRLPHHDSAAEVALVVIDEYHNCGLGGIFLRKIRAESEQRQIETLYFYTLSENAPLVAMLKKTGWNIQYKRDAQALTLVVDLDKQAETQDDILNATLDLIKNYQLRQVDLLRELATVWLKIYALSHSKGKANTRIRRLKGRQLQ